MFILKLIFSIIILLIIPTLVGLLFTKPTKQKNSLLWAFVVGYFAEFAIFQLLYLPMYFAECSFKILQYTYEAIIVIIVLVSLIINRKRFSQIAIINLELLKKMPNIMLVFAVLLIIQIYFPVMYMRVDLDDAFYLANSLTTIETNTMFKVYATTGNDVHTTHYARYCLSGLTIYYAAISEILGIHATIFQHTIWPAIAIILAFSIYALLANKLFDRDKEKVGYFLVFLSVIHIFGFVYLYFDLVYLLCRNWQGKGLVVSIIIPAIYLIYMYCTEKSEQINYWIFLILVNISAVFVSCTSVVVLPFQIGALCLINLVQEKKISNISKTLLCSLPLIVAGILYLVIK